MSIRSTISSVGARILDAPRWETDGGFREELERVNRRGLLAGGTLAVAGVVIYLIVSIAVLSKTVIWLPTSDPVLRGQTIALWDKLLVLFSGIALFAVNRFDGGVRWGRFVAAAVILMISAASVFDDINGGVAGAPAAYPTLFLLVAAGAIPFRPLQMLGLCVVTYGGVLIGVEVLPAVRGLEFEGATVEQVPFVFIGTVVLTGIATLLHVTRYDQYRARAEAQRLAAELVEAERLKDRFFANISHEFRSPLTVIMGPVHDALDGGYGSIPPAMVSMLSVVQRSGQRLLRLVNDLLDLAQLDAGKVRLQVEEQDLVPFVRTAVHEFVDLAARREITLTFQTSTDHLLASFDPDAMEKVVSNLLDNACKFAPGGAVKVRLVAECRESGNRAVVTVRDSGRGIEPHDLTAIWDRFHRIEKDAPTEGTGIGLALVKELVELHGGEVDVRSEPGFGSEFEVALPLPEGLELPERLRSLFDIPLLPGGEAAAEEGPGMDGSDAVSGATVLVVDNDEDIRAYVRRILGGIYRVREAGDGEAALEAIRAERPDLVITDVMMPRMDGLELCRRIKSDTELAEIPVVLLTALAEEPEEVEGLHAGADDYISKPFSSAALLARVENLLELRRMLRLHHTADFVEPSPVDVPSADASFMERVKQAVEEHIGDSNFGVEWLADEVGLSARHLQRRVRAVTRLSAAGYIRLMRLKRASQLLERRAGNVSEVAYAVGFRDPAYFSRLFKVTFRVLPSEYGKEAAEPADDEVAATPDA